LAPSFGFVLGVLAFSGLISVLFAGGFVWIGIVIVYALLRLFWMLQIRVRVKLVFCLGRI
jgi:membrane-bound ClpP family serine protease